MNVEMMPVGPRTILCVDGKPAAVRLLMREATTAPSRVKASLVLMTENGDGSQGAVPLPFAQATMGSSKPKGFAVEFRLEQN